MAVNPYSLNDYQRQPAQEPQGDKAATPESFNPKFNKNQIKSIINSYKNSPSAFKPEDIEQIKQHAIYHNVGFYEGDFQISEALMQFMGGAFEGFTTFSVIDPPDNEYEAIARSAGHLFGFAPGLAAKPLKYLGLRNAAAAIAGKESIPLMFGSGATKIVGKKVKDFLPAAREDATNIVTKFLTKGSTKSVIEEGFKLGVASAVSNWKQGVNGMLVAAKEGGEFGGAFQALANVVPGSGPFKYALRAIAGSLYQGLPSTQRGATTPEQVYEYMLGAYFGGGATNWIQKDKGQFFKERNEQMYGTKGTIADAKLQQTGDPSLVKTWGNYDRVVQKEIMKELNDPNYLGEGKPSINWKPQHQLKEGETYAERTAFLEHLIKSAGIDTKLATVSNKGWERFNRLTQDAIVGSKPTNLALKTEKELNDLNSSKKIFAEKLQTAEAELTSKKGSEKILLENDIANYKKELIKINNREKKLLDLKPFEWIDKEGNFQNERINDDGNDIGMVSNRDLTKKSERFVNDNLGEIWDKKSYDPIDKRNEVLRLTGLVDDVLLQEKYVKPEQKVDTTELIKELKDVIEKEEGYRPKISKNTENDLRQFLTRKNFSKPVKYLNLTVDKKGNLSDITFREDGFTNAGNRKESLEPKKEVQRVLEEVLELPKDTKLEDIPEASVVLDNMTFRGEKGQWRDGTLSNIRQLISKNKFSKKEKKKAREVYEKLISDIHKKMAKDGYYPFGGKGDNDIIIYIKKHPNLLDSSKKNYVNSYVTKLRAKLENDVWFKDAIDRNKFFSKEEAREQYISNIMWDISLNGFKPKTKAEYNKVLDKLFSGEGYIKNATAWNKRQQIWFTPAFRADKDFVYNSYKKYIKDLTKSDTSDISPEFKKALKNGDVNYAIVRDLDPKLFKIVADKLQRIKKLDKDSKNTEMDEHVDGMILVEDSVLKAIIKDSGMPESGQSKSFIVSPDANNGALLGKYMMHSVGEKASKQMRKAGIHMIMQESAVKQRGERKITDYKLEGDTVKISDPSAVYKLPLEHIKYSYSVKNDNSMIGLNNNGTTHKHGIPKQLLMAMAQNTFKSFPKELIDDFYTETIKKKFDGKKEINELYDDYVKNPNSKKLLSMLEKNINDLGIDKLLDAINETPTNFTDAAYMRLMKLQMESIREKVADGEISHEEAEKLTDNINEFNSSTDRIVEAGQSWKNREILLGREGNINPLLLHKWIRPYRFQVIRNYIFNSLSRPKIGNSGVARMRGYDKWFQQDKKFADLETNDEIFYLDNAFKRMPLKTNIKKFEETTLGELWAEHKNFEKAEKKQAENLMTALTVRVPMDSVSGAQRMQFKGFTGRDGHGVLMHGRAMKAEGGADLDGDESFIFFGGREGDKGGGFRKEWIDKFHENKNEFLEKDGTTYNNKNEEITKSLTVQDSQKTTGINPKARDSKMWQYDSQWRQDISERAVDGRNLLGGAVSSAQILKSVHNSLLGVEKNDKFTTTQKRKKYEVEIEARTDETELKEARKLASSMIAFTSDPLDFAGLTGYRDYISKLTDAYFKVKINGKETKVDKENLRLVDNKQSVIGQMREVNQGLYSRDYINNKSFDAVEIKQKTKWLNPSSSSLLSNYKAQNSMLPKIGRLASEIDLYDSPFNSINLPNLKKMYDDHDNITSKIPMFKDLLSNVKVASNKLVFKIINDKLYEKSNVEEAARNLSKFYSYIDHPQSMFSSKGAERKNFNKNRANIKGEEGQDYRVGKLKELVKMTEDFLSQDVSDMVSLRQIYRYYDGVDVNKTLFNKMLRKVNQIKSDSYLQRDDVIEGNQEAVKRKIIKSFGYNDIDAIDKSKTLNQAEIDLDIANYKNTLPNARAKKLFDMLMLGTFRHSKLKTGVNKLGFSSKAINNSSLIDFVGDFTNVMNKAYSKEKVDKDITEKLFEEVVIEKNLPENTILENTTTGYEGLHGKPNMKLIPKQVRQELTELVEVLDKYHNKVGQNLNLIVRDLLKKDFNAMDYADIKNLNRYFKELNAGTFLQRLFREKTPDIRKRYTMQFPLTVNRQTMKYDISLMKKRGMFITQAGNFEVGDMLKPTQVSEKLLHGMTIASDKGQAKGDEEVIRLRKDLGFLDGIEEGEAFRRVGVRELEKDGSVSRVINRGDVAGRIWANSYLNDLKSEIKDSNYEVVKNNKYRVTTRNKEGKVIRTEVLGSDLVAKTKDVYKNHFKKMYKLIQGNKELLDAYHSKNNFGKKMYHDFKDFRDLDDPISGGKRKAPMEPIYDYKKFVNDIYESYERGKDILPDIGIDGIRAMARSMMIQLHPKYLKKSYPLIDFRKKIGLTMPTGEIVDGYWPHMIFDKVKVTKSLNDAYEKISSSNLSKEEKVKQLKQLQLKKYQLTGEWINGTENWDAYDDVVIPERSKASDRITWQQSLQMTPFMNKRTSHIPGHSIDATVPELYTRNLYKTYYKQLAQILSRKTIFDFNKRADELGWDKLISGENKRSLKSRWSDWYSLYVQDALGHPTKIPEYILKDPEMKISGTPYAWFADNVVTDKMNSIAKKLGLKSPVKGQPRYDINTIRDWSNTEGRWQLMALLAHPKSAVTNLFGGTLHTIQSAGATSLRKVYDYEYLKKINPDFNSRQKIKDFAIGQGVFPEMLAHEWGMQRSLQTKNKKGFVKELVETVSKKGTIDKEKLKEIGKKYSLTQSSIDFAARFMSVPEMKLRTDAFMSHYIKAWEMFGGAISQHDHPFLIEMAKKGVKASQFLYDASNRPAFARSGLGKMMTRFQLWSWNAWRFRNDVNREARQRGYTQGTPEYERFKRTASIDLMVYALGSVFAMSLFDNAIPAPLNHLKETTEWLFGDEKERERAFWGTYPRPIAPLQAITPPILGKVMSTLKAFTDDGLNDFVQYHMYTMFPFGRMIKDVSPFVKGNLLDNPYRLIEKTTGLPYGALQRERSKYKEETAYHPKFNNAKVLKEMLEN
mgnify:FL=1